MERPHPSAPRTTVEHELEFGFEGGIESGRTIVENAFIIHYLPRAPKTYVQVYLAGLMRCFGYRGSHFASVEMLAREQQISARSVQRALEYWENLGLIKRVPRYLRDLSDPRDYRTEPDAEYRIQTSNLIIYRDRRHWRPIDDLPEVDPEPVSPAMDAYQLEDMSAASVESNDRTGVQGVTDVSPENECSGGDSGVTRGGDSGVTLRKTNREEIMHVSSSMRARVRAHEMGQASLGATPPPEKEASAATPDTGAEAGAAVVPPGENLPLTVPFGATVETMPVEEREIDYGPIIEAAQRAGILMFAGRLRTVCELAALRGMDERVIAACIDDAAAQKSRRMTATGMAKWAAAFVTVAFEAGVRTMEDYMQFKRARVREMMNSMNGAAVARPSRASWEKRGWVSTEIDVENLNIDWSKFGYQGSGATGQ